MRGGTRAAAHTDDGSAPAARIPTPTVAGSGNAMIAPVEPTPVEMAPAEATRGTRGVTNHTRHVRDKPIAKAADKPVDKPIDKPIDKPVDKPTDKPVDKPVEDDDAVRSPFSHK